LLPSPARPKTDAALLKWWVERKDQQAFAGLVRRHGPMVLGVCYRVLGDWQDAEDVFQCTFLTLARNPRKVRRPEALASFLYGVALRLAQKARARRDHRTVSTGSTAPEPVDPRPQPLDALSGRELLAVIDAEVARLPEVYRLPVLLCVLQERSVEEAARILNWTPDSVRGRLARGRVRLRQRLTRRGLGASAGAIALLAGAHVPNKLLAATLHAATGAAPALDGGAKALFALKMLCAILFVQLIGVAVALLFHREPQRSDTAAPAPPVAVKGAPARPVSSALVPSLPTAAKASPPALPGRVIWLPSPPTGLLVPPGEVKKQALDRILFWKEGRLATIDPMGDGFKWVAGPNPPGHFVAIGQSPRLSRDGRYIFFRLDKTPHGGEFTLGDLNWGKADRLLILAIDHPESPLELTQEPCGLGCWSPDGEKIVAYDSYREKRWVFLNHWLFDVKTKKKSPLEIPEGHEVCDWSPDGKWFLTTSHGKGLYSRLHLISADLKQVKQIGDPKQIAADGRFSPDGKKILYLCRHGAEPRQLYVLDLATGKTQPVSPVYDRDFGGYAWSPDGMSIAYQRGDVGELRSVVIAGNDGSHPQIVLRAKRDEEILLLDWR
jgi:RNA polymerase sigma factor (sigma-70 family)